MTILENLTRYLIAEKFITSITGSISDRAKRKIEKTGDDIYDRLKRNEQLSKDSKLIIGLGWSDEAENWARGVALALKEFKQENSEAYNQFEEIRKKHLKVRRAYLRFGGEIVNTDYVEVIREIIGEDKFSEEQALRFYETLVSIEKTFKRKNEKESRYLLPE